MEAVVADLEKVNVSYDKGRDVLYVSFGEPQEAEDSDLTENDIIIRYKEGKVIGLTILSFSKRAV